MAHAQGPAGGAPRYTDIAGVAAHMRQILGEMQAANDPNAVFLSVYLRTTQAVGAEVAAGRFLDGPWVEEWDVAFADLYVVALEAHRVGRPVPRPWEIAFSTSTDDVLRRLLLGMNAHINYDLPQALLTVIGDAEFDDPALLARRGADHAHVDDVLAQRVGAEDDELVAFTGPRTLTDRLLAPLNRLGTRRFLRESRAKVWANTRRLAAARRQGPDAYAVLLAELEALSAARVADLEAPGQVLLKLAVRGFGVELPAS